MVVQKPFSDDALLASPPEPEILTAADRAAIQEKARETVQKEVKEKAEKAALAVAIEEERKNLTRHQLESTGMTQVLIDLPGHSDRLTINGTMYFHGHTYTVPLPMARDMQSMMARAWDHENEVGGANRDAYQKPRNHTLRPGASL